MKIAVVGGTGKEGSALAFRWARAGVEVVIGSREEQKAQRVADELNRSHQGPKISGLNNAAAAAAADHMVVLTVPYAAHQKTLEEIKSNLSGKILVDVTVPLDPQNPRRVIMPREGSATEEAMAILGEGTKVVAALQNVSSGSLHDYEHPIHCDILVCGKDKEAKAAVIALMEKLGVRAFDAGTEESARAVEAMTAVLIGLNIKYKLKHAGLKIWEGD